MRCSVFKTSSYDQHVLPLQLIMRILVEKVGKRQQRLLINALFDTFYIYICSVWKDGDALTCLRELIYWYRHVIVRKSPIGIRKDLKTDQRLMRWMLYHWTTLHQHDIIMQNTWASNSGDGAATAIPRWGKTMGKIGLGFFICKLFCKSTPLPL